MNLPRLLVFILSVPSPPYGPLSGSGHIAWLSGDSYDAVDSEPLSGLFQRSYRSQENAGLRTRTFSGSRMESLQCHRDASEGI